MSVKEKIPIIVGVTGHRHLDPSDVDALKDNIEACLTDIKKLCKSRCGGEDTPIVMLNAFAQGADMLCAEVAEKLGIDIYAVLPRPEEEYIKSFDDKKYREKLLSALSKTKRRFIAPDIENSRSFMNITKNNYEYRQTGIYIAEHSHILLALWNGNPPKNRYGCGTVDVIKFALDHNYLDHDGMFKPGTVNDSAAVIHINARKKGEEKQEIKHRWLIAHVPTVEERNRKNSTEQDAQKFENRVNLETDAEENNTVENADENNDGIEPKIIKDRAKAVYYEHSDVPPEYLNEIIDRTVEYNDMPCGVKDDDIEKKLWIEDKTQKPELDEYRKSLRYHYAKTDDLSYRINQIPYNKILLALAVLGTLVALFFLIYDDAALPFMIIPCTAAIVAVIATVKHGEKKKYHKNYTLYRTFAEALRIQFYLSACINEDEIITSVCDLCPWTQKVGMLWIHKAIQALAVVHPSHKLNITTSDVVHVWLERNPKDEKLMEEEKGGPEGQENYHNRKLKPNRETANRHEKLSDIFKYIAIGLYSAVLLLEIACYLARTFDYSLFWENIAFGHLAWRNIGAIILGIGTAGSLLLSSYWGKLSFDRKAADNVRMLRFYSSAVTRWEDAIDRTPREKEKFFKEIAREEIIENGIWCSYVNENRLELNI